MLLDSDLLALVTGPVSIVVSSRDGDLRPSVARAYGCRYVDGRLRVFILRNEAGALAADVAHTRVLAAVFSHFRTFRTVQVKGSDARLEEFDAADGIALERYRAASSIELAGLGQSETTAQAFLSSQPAAARVTVSFSPGTLFQQTPGPGAGAPLVQSR